MNHAEVVDQAWEFLRGHSRCELRFDEHVRPIKYIVASDGRPAAPVMVAMLEAVDCVLFVPECSEGAMELQVTLLPFHERGEDGAVADRWRIYHGDPDDVRWAYFLIDAARFGEMVIDGEALIRPNPLAADESRLCRYMNQDHAEALRRLCARFGQMAVEQPVMVGIDPMGIDVRARFQVLRVPATEPMNNAEDAMRVLHAMSSAAQSG